MRAVRQFSHQRYRFLGSWHTHPDGLAIPSGRDTATAREIAADPGVRVPAPLILIQATQRSARGATPTELAGWRWDQPGRRLVRDAVEAIELEQRWCPLVTVRGGRRANYIAG